MPKLPFLLLLFLLTTTVTPSPRRILHQPFFPEDPIPTTPTPPSQKYPFSTQTTPPNSPSFFPNYPSQSQSAPPPPTIPSAFASFPANISSLTLPSHSKPKSTSSKLIAAAVSSVLAAVAVVSLVLFLRNKRHVTNSPSSLSRSKTHRSDSTSSTPSLRHIPKLNRPSQTSAEFLYLGTLVNSHNLTATSSLTTRKTESPELRPLPPLHAPASEEDEEFYSPKGSLGAVSSSRRGFSAVEVEDFNNAENSSSSSVTGSSPARSVSLSLSPSLSPNRNSIPKSPDLIEIVPETMRDDDEETETERRGLRYRESVSPSPPSSYCSSNERYDTRKGSSEECLSSPNAGECLVVRESVSCTSSSSVGSSSDVESPIITYNVTVIPHSPPPPLSPPVVSFLSPPPPPLVSVPPPPPPPVVSFLSPPSPPVVSVPPPPSPPVVSIPPPPPPPPPSPPVVSIPPPPPPPPLISPRTWTPPAKKSAWNPPALIRPFRPLGLESPSTISPLELPKTNESESVNKEESPNKEIMFSNPAFERNDDETTPKTKLKPLHWDKVKVSSDKEMIWDQLKCSSFQLNEDMIESLFLVNTQKPSPNEATRWQVLPSPGQDSGNRVLDPKKAQNIAILLRALHVTVEEVCEGLLEGNVDALGTELLESLLKMAPTKEEERKLKEYKEDSTVKLGAAERFLKAVVDIPYAFKRVDAMLYISNFESEVEYLKKSFATLEAACEELRTSRMFLKLLEAVLKTGNRMNVGTYRGYAHAFKLDTLLKLVDVKGADGKTTLLHFVVQEIIRIEGSRLSGAPPPQENPPSVNDDVKSRKLGLQVVSAITSELSNVKKAAVMDAEVLGSDVSKISKGIENIREVIRLIEGISSSEENGTHKFCESMAGFVKKAEEEIIRIQAQESVALSLVKEITEYFHGNSAKEEPHPFRIFLVVRDFLAVLDRVCKEVGTINDRTIVSSALRFPVPVNPMLQQVPDAFHKQPNTSSDEDAS